MDDVEDDRTGRIVVDVGECTAMDASIGNYTANVNIIIKTLLSPHEDISALKTAHRTTTGLVRDFFFAPNILDELQDLGAGALFNGIHALSLTTTAAENYLYSTLTLKLEIAVTA